VQPPDVTVIIPTRNRAGWLAQSVRAVLDQTHRQLRLVVTDNASTDDTAAVVAGFDDDRLTYLRRPDDVGLVANHNLALAEVDTPYVLIVPDDDVIHPELLERAVETLEANPRVGMVHSRFDMIGPAGEVLAPGVDWTYGLSSRTVERGEQFIEQSMRWSCRVCASTAVMRTAALPEGFFDPDDFPPVDLGLWLRMALRWDMAFDDRCLAAYRIHDGSHSAAFGGTISDGYLQDPGLLDSLRRVKLRFLHRHRAALGGADRVARLERLARRSTRHELLVYVRSSTLPERDRSRTFELLRETARMEPALAFDPVA
jgi:glycosyltransferase involved in cell wall biosynthesis